MLKNASASLSGGPHKKEMIKRYEKAVFTDCIYFVYNNLESFLFAPNFCILSSSNFFCLFSLFYSAYSLFCKSRPPSALGDKNDTVKPVPFELFITRDSEQNAHFYPKMSTEQYRTTKNQLRNKNH